MKFVKVTYGSSGDSEKKQYVYIANDNVRVGDTVQPTFTHKTKDGVGKLCTTTAVIKSASKIGSKSATNEEMTEELVDSGTMGNIKRIYTGADLDVQQEKDSKGKFIKDKSTHDSDGNFILGDFDKKVRDMSYNRTAKEGFVNGYALIDAINKSRFKAKEGPVAPAPESPYVNVQTKETSGAESRTFKNDSNIMKPFSVPVPKGQLEK